MNKKKITIIGAGVSGLYLAYLLEKKYDVTIVEARDRVGGRIHSINTNDMGPSWVWSHQKKILKLISELKLELFSQYTQGLALFDTKAKLEKFQPQPSAPSARMKGTLSSLIDELKSRLTDTKIILSEEVKSVQETQNGVKIQTENNTYESEIAILTLAPRLTAKLNFTPPLEETLKTKMLGTQTWMGSSAKCVVEFKKSLWKEAGLSGFTFSHIGPLGEIHDASEGEKHALFGFVSANANMSTFGADLNAQLHRLFDFEESEVLAIYLVDWREEKFSSAPADQLPLTAHPQYGINTNSYSQRILFSSTEFSFDNGGYIEGAISLAEEVAEKLL